jgi:hypothetical protein
MPCAQIVVLGEFTYIPCWITKIYNFPYRNTWRVEIQYSSPKLGERLYYIFFWFIREEIINRRAGHPVWNNNKTRRRLSKANAHNIRSLQSAHVRPPSNLSRSEILDWRVLGWLIWLSRGSSRRIHGADRKANWPPETSREQTVEKFMVFRLWVMG